MKHLFLMVHFILIISVIFLPFLSIIVSESEVCRVNDGDNCHPSPSNKWSTLAKTKRYFLYDVNPGEGFNLKRDVYMRVATLVNILNKKDYLHEWVLVLPPWGPMYHWKTKSLGAQIQIKWSEFFDISSLATYVPVIELENFLDAYGFSLDVVYYLQHYAEDWTDDGWTEKFSVQDCINSPPYKKILNGSFIGWFWGYDDIYSKKFHCLSVQGYSNTLTDFFIASNDSVIMIDRAEVILHNSFGDAEYWKVRRSMIFSKKLISLGNTFRKLYLNSSDKEDKTVKNSNWISNHNRTAVGGPYVAVHLRRQDFLTARPKEVPSIKFAAEQIIKEMKRLNLTKLFVATDAFQSEFLELKSYIPGAVRFIPSKDVHKNVLDGGIAIVDQWICAHARFFIGTFESTFSFRIQEEREILGFKIEATFNRLCGDSQKTCQQPSKWTIVYN